MERIRWIVLTMRPRQWMKNLFVLAAPVLSGQMLDVQQMARGLAAFVLFCLASGALYLINDVADSSQDRLHPLKRRRPVASGKLSAALAVGVGCGLLGVSGGFSFWLNPLFGKTLAIYTVLALAYSFWLKRVVIVDVLVVAIGYVLRLLGGGFVVGIVSTPWSIICVFFLALLLISGKRLAERISHEDSSDTRPVLDRYPVPFLRQVLLIAVASTLITYALFTVTSGKDVRLIITLPSVVYGVLRYLYLIETEAAGESPETIVFRDWPFLLNLIGWGFLTVGVLYFFR